MSRHALPRRPPSRMLTAGAVALLVSGAALGLAGVDAGAATSTTIGLGTDSAASVLAGAGVTNTGPSVLALDVDSSPTKTINGFPPGETRGTEHANDAIAVRAQKDLTTAYNVAQGAPSTANVTSVDLGGKTLTQGVYTASTGLMLNGALTLSGGPAAVFVFQAGSTLITGPDSSVSLVGGAQACNVYWQVGSSATLGTGTTFVGNILALTSISLDSAATVDGRALAMNGAVTLNDNTFTHSACTGSTAPTTTTTAAAPTTTTTVGSTTTTAGGPTTTTTAGPTTTTSPATTTTTSMPATTSTTTSAPATSSTTTGASTTTTSLPPTTSTTVTSAATTTTLMAPTTTTAVFGLTTGSGQGTGTGGGSTTGGDGSTGLATTGTDAEGLGLSGAALIGAGSLLLLLTRRRRYP
jgi:hypothetical protein